MAVYTQVDASQVQTFLQDQGLGEYVSHEGITQGVENTNYHLFTTSGRYILTIFEKRTDPASLPFIFSFTKHLASKNIPVPPTLAQGMIVGKPAAITQYLEGCDLSRDAITPDHCRQFGAVLAKMHLAVADFTGTRGNPVGIETWQRLHAACGDAVPHDLVDPILSDFKNIPGLPSGAIHADLCQDNVFFDANGKFSGVIDFYFSCVDSFVYDLAVTVNSWCFDTANNLIPARLKAFIEGYESVRPLSAPERAAWEPVRKAAALRMFSTRLYDWLFTPADADVKKHDPNEYRAKMEIECPLPQ